MRQTLIFANKPMRVAFTKTGNDVWIVYHRVHTGQDTRDNPEYTERGHLYSSAEGPGRLTNKNIDSKTFVGELNINGVKDYQWRTHAYVLWKGEFGEARWKYEGDGHGGVNNPGDDDESDGDGNGDASARTPFPHYLPRPKLDSASERPVCTPEVRRATLFKWQQVGCYLHAQVEALKAEYPNRREMEMGGM